MTALSIVLSGWAGVMLTSISFVLISVPFAATLYGGMPTDVNFGWFRAFRFPAFDTRINIGWLQLGTGSFDYYDSDQDDMPEKDSSLYDEDELEDCMTTLPDFEYDYQEEPFSVPWKNALLTVIGLFAMCVPALILIGPAALLETIFGSLQTMWLLVVSPGESGLSQILQSYADQPIAARLGLASAAYIAFELLPSPLNAGGRIILSGLGMLGVPNRYLMQSTAVIVAGLILTYGFAAYLLYNIFSALPW